MKGIRPYYDFELRTLDNNIWDAQMMATIIRDWKDNVIALFFVPGLNNGYHDLDCKLDSNLGLLAAHRVGSLSPLSFRRLIDICPESKEKYFTSMLLIRHPNSPLDHTMTLAFNTRYIEPEMLAGDSDKPFDYSKEELNFIEEARFAVGTLIKYAPQANLIFLSNGRVWGDAESIKDAMSNHVRIQIENALIRQANVTDYYADGWRTEY